MSAFLLHQGPGNDSREVTELLDQLQRPALLHLLYCRIEFGPVGHLTLDAGWEGLVDHCLLMPAAEFGPVLTLESYPGVEIDWRGTPGALLPVTVLQIEAEAQRQRQLLLGRP